jgi:hypothetical protein
VKRAAVVLQRYLGQALQERQDTRGCAIHAHLALMWRSADLLDGGIGRAAVSALLRAQAFLSAHYSCESADSAVDSSSAAIAAGSSSGEAAAAAAAGRSGWKDLGVPEVEIFTLFQRFRADVLRWCERHVGGECNAVMDEVVAAVVLGGGGQISGLEKSTGATRRACPLP